MFWGLFSFFFFFFLVAYCSWTVTLIVLSHIYVRCADKKNNPWFWCSHNIPLMIKMLNQNMTQRGTQATGLGIMIGRCSPDSQHGRPDRHSANVGCSFFRYTNDDLRNHTNQRRKQKTWTREDNPLALHCYFRSNPSQRGFRKRMLQIWQECASF